MNAETQEEVKRSEIAEEFIRSMEWAPGTPDEVKTIAAGNVRGFWNWLNQRGRSQVPDKDMDEATGIPMHDTVHNAVGKVYFRAGLLTARESLARFVEAAHPHIAESIRLNWWPQLGPDPGMPRFC